MKQGSTVLQACESVGIEVPRFCYHERLSIAGNCRMCLVEIEKTPKPVASCAMPIMQGMKIYTDTPLVKKSRESVLEFLLLNHPLDCPICDQGGECDLQDQALVFGSDRSRFYETKRTVENKNYGPLVKTIMTRCIHCTRCVRFATEIAGVEDLGCTGRGNDTEIGTYIGDTMKSELSGNVIDLCPVGALTSKPHAFTSRPWEIRSANSVDISDGLGSNTKIDFRGVEVLRILPRFKEEINEEWISDKIRFLYDGLKRQRIGHPLERKEGDLTKVNWKSTLKSLKESFKNTDPSKVEVVIGGEANLETLAVTRDFLNKLGVSKLSYQNTSPFDCVDDQMSYSFNSGIQDIENSDVCLIVNANPRHDATLLNARLRKRYLQGGFNVGLIGSFNEFTFPIQHLGTSIHTLNKVIEGSHSFCKAMSNAQNLKVIFCIDSLNNTQLDFLKTQSILLGNLFPGKDFISFLSTSPNEVGAKELGIINTLGTTPTLKYIIDNDESKSLSNSRFTSNFWSSRILNSKADSKLIYQGHHGDLTANSRVDLLLPGASFTEERSIYINSERRAQKSKRVHKAPLAIRENWKIVKAISDSLLGYFSYKDLFNRLVKLTPSVSHLGNIIQCSSMNLNKGYVDYYSKSNNIKYTPMRSKLDNYYTTNTITRASETMAECSLAFVSKTNF